MAEENQAAKDPEKQFNSILEELNEIFQSQSISQPPVIKIENPGFTDNFKQILSSQIRPLVVKFNDHLKGRRLFILSDEAMKTNSSNRKFIQVVLSPNPDHPDVIRDPYLLIEGYPQSGQVRISQSNADTEGKVLAVEGVTQNILETSVFSFLKESAKAPK